MPIAKLTIELEIPHAQSLKDRRQVVRSMKDKLRHSFNLSIAELDDGVVWNRATLGIAPSPPPPVTSPARSSRSTTPPTASPAGSPDPTPKSSRYSYIRDPAQNSVPDIVGIFDILKYSCSTQSLCPSNEPEPTTATESPTPSPKRSAPCSKANSPTPASHPATSPTSSSPPAANPPASS